VSRDRVTIEPRDSFRKRVYLAPLGLWLTLDAGTFRTVEVNPQTQAVRIGLSPRDRFTPKARLRLEQPFRPAGVGTFRPEGEFALERDAYTIPLKRSRKWVVLSNTR